MGKRPGELTKEAYESQDEDKIEASISAMESKTGAGEPPPVDAGETNGQLSIGSSEKESVGESLVV